MNRLRSLLRRLLLSKPSGAAATRAPHLHAPKALLGTLSVRLIKCPISHHLVRLHLEGHHTGTLSAASPECVFDLFRHATLSINYPRGALKLHTKCLNSKSTPLSVSAPGGVSLQVSLSVAKAQLRPEDFQALRVLGRGATGKVLLWRHIRSQRLYACKVLRKAPPLSNAAETQSLGAYWGTAPRILNEKEILTRTHASPFLIRLLAAFQTPDRVYLVLPYVEGGELFKRLQELGRFSEATARLYLGELLMAVKHLHQMGIIYRDIKPENVLLDREGHLVLCDFGMSALLPPGRPHVLLTYCGTPEYLAPEVIKGETQTPAVDIYTLGVLLYEMLTGHPPFTAHSETEPREDLEARILFSAPCIPESVSEGARSLIERLLRKSPKSRPTVEEIEGHPFFQGVDWGKVLRREYPPEYVPGEGSGRRDQEGASPGGTPGALPPGSAATEGSTHGDPAGTIQGLTYCTEDWEESSAN